MRIILLTLFCITSVMATSYAEEVPTPAAAAPAAAKEEGQEADEEHKKPADEKPRRDSAVAAVSTLPVVREWEKWMPNDHGKMDVWGEGIDIVHGSKCWSVAVAEIIDDESRIWRHFCVMQTGLEIWVRSISPDKAGDFSYMTFDNWMTKCTPKYNNAGSC